MSEAVRKNTFQLWQNAEKKNSEYRHFLRSAKYPEKLLMQKNALLVNLLISDIW